MRKYYLDNIRWIMVLAVMGGLLLYEIVSRIPILRWCVLGMKRQSKQSIKHGVL